MSLIANNMMNMLLYYVLDPEKEKASVIVVNDNMGQAQNNSRKK